MKVLAATLTLLLLATAPGRLHAQEPTAAEQSFREGREAMLNGDYVRAERAFEASLRAETSAAALLNLAVVEERLGDLLSARSHLQQMLGLLDATDERYAEGLRLMATLDQGSPTVEGQAPAVAREQDRSVVSPPTEPVQQSTGLARKQSEKNEVVSSRPLASYLLAGLGVGAIGLSVGTGLAALGKRDEALAECPRKQCTDLGLSAAADARRYAAISTVSLTAAVTSLGVASWLFFAHRSQPASQSLAFDVSVSREHSRISLSGAF